MRKPVITSLPAIANMNAILGHYEDKYWPWFVQNHIQLVGWDNPELYVQFYYPLFRKHYPLLSNQTLNKKYVQRMGEDMAEVFMDFLDDDQYIYLSVDTYYIPAYKNANQYHHPHDMLIYGYDSKRKRFMIADFFNGSYEFTEASFEEVLQAVNSSHCEDEYFNHIQLLKYNPNEAFTLDMQHISLMLNDYLTSYKTSSRYKMVEEPGKDTDAWGISVFDILKKNLQDHSSANIRSLHLLWDHKVAMTYLVNYLGAEGKLRHYKAAANDYAEIETEALVIRNLGLKYNMNNSNVLFDGLLTRLTKLKEKESDAIKRLLDLINE